MIEAAQHFVTFCAGFVIGGLYTRHVLRKKP